MITQDLADIINTLNLKTDKFPPDLKANNTLRVDTSKKELYTAVVSAFVKKFSVAAGAGGGGNAGTRRRPSEMAGGDYSSNSDLNDDIEFHTSFNKRDFMYFDDLNANDDYKNYSCEKLLEFYQNQLSQVQGADAAAAAAEEDATTNFEIGEFNNLEILKSQRHKFHKMVDDMKNIKINRPFLMETRNRRKSFYDAVEICQFITELVDYYRILIISHYNDKDIHSGGGNDQFRNDRESKMTAVERYQQRHDVRKYYKPEQKNKLNKPEPKPKPKPVIEPFSQPIYSNNFQYNQIFEILNYLKTDWLKPIPVENNSYNSDIQAENEELFNISPEIKNVFDAYRQLFKYYVECINNKNSVFSINNSNFIRNGLFLYFLDQMKISEIPIFNKDNFNKIFELGETKLNKDQENFLYNEFSFGYQVGGSNTNQRGGTRYSEILGYLRIIDEETETFSKLSNKSNFDITKVKQSQEEGDEEGFYTENFCNVINNIGEQLNDYQKGKHELNADQIELVEKNLSKSINSVIMTEFKNILGKIEKKFTEAVLFLEKWDGEDGENGLKVMILNIVEQIVNNEFNDRINSKFGTKRQNKHVGIVKKLTPIFEKITQLFRVELSKDHRIKMLNKTSKDDNAKGATEQTKIFTNNLLKAICGYAIENSLPLVESPQDDFQKMYNLQHTILTDVKDGVRSVGNIDHELFVGLGLVNIPENSIEPDDDDSQYQQIIDKLNFKTKENVYVVNNALGMKVHNGSQRGKFADMLIDPPNDSFTRGCPPATKLDAMETFGSCHDKPVDNVDDIDATFFYKTNEDNEDKYEDNEDKYEFELNYRLIKNKKNVYITEYYFRKVYQKDSKNEYEFIRGSNIEQNVALNGRANLLLSAVNTFERVLDIIEKKSVYIALEFTETDLDANRYNPSDINNIIASLSNKAMGDFGQEITSLIFGIKKLVLFIGTDKPSFVRAHLLRIGVDSFKKNDNTRILYGSEKGKSKKDESTYSTASVYISPKPPPSSGGGKTIMKRSSKTKRKITKRKKKNQQLRKRKFTKRNNRKMKGLKKTLRKKRQMMTKRHRK